MFGVPVLLGILELGHPAFSPWDPVIDTLAPIALWWTALQVPLFGLLGLAVVLLRWLDELLFDPTQTVESLGVRESKSERSSRMTLSLAFVSPALAEAAMEGRLPRGFCVKRLTDLPMLWSEQWGAIGLQAPAQVRAELR